MAARVVLSFRLHRRTCDWTPAEIAELYRIEHSLVQARLAVLTDRGITDDGDPWFVFCRADGEVFAHIARFDGEYHLFSPALPSPLRGRVFSDLSKSFVNQIPLHIPVRSGGDNKLFVHPAATLAIIIGTILIACDDSCLFPDASHRKAAHIPGHGSPVDKAASAIAAKATLQSAFLNFIASSLESARAELASHDSAYLNIVCAIAAFIVGAVSSGTDGDQSSTVAVDALQQTSDQAHVTLVAGGDGSAVNIDAFGERVSGAAQTTHGAIQNELVARSGSEDSANGNGLPLKMADSHLTVPHDDNASVLRLEHDHGLTSDNNVIGQENNVGGGGSHFVFSAGVSPQTSWLLSVAAAQNQSTVSVAAPVATKGQADVSSATASISGHLNIALAQLSDVGQQTSLQNAAGSAPSSGGSISLLQILNSAAAGVHPIFDGSAVSALTSFWGANPHASAIYENQNIIVYDGTSSLASAAVHTWALGQGAVITVVGQVDIPPAHALS